MNKKNRDKTVKIVLVRPNYNSHIITPPLGLGYLASYLKSEGIDAVVIDGLREALSTEGLIGRILSEEPDAVGITCLTAFYEETVDLSRRLKDKGLKVVIGGVHPTFLPYQTLTESNADYVICGEGEIALAKLAKNGFVNDGIQGVYSKGDLKDEKQQVVKAQAVERLDDLPFPDWEQIDPNLYPRAPHGAIVKNFPIGVVMTTRGCPYECTFCASPGFYERKVRFRSPENVVREIKHLVEKFGVKEIHFEDDNLTLKRDHIAKICNLMIENDLKVSWACPNGIRADKVDEDLIALMAKSGCYYFAYGVESANPQILKNIKKRESIEDIEKAIEIAHRKGIQCQGFFIFGLPGETDETIEETIDFACRSKLSRAQFLILDVLPGSELWEKLEGRFTPKWSKQSYREPEWIPENLTKEKLLNAQARAFRRFYLRPRVFFRLARLVDLKQMKFLVKRVTDYRMYKQ